MTRRDRIFELSKIQRGMRGVGYTVFEADIPERFEFEVLGLMRAMLGPGRDVILVKLIGEKIERTGVISGMSGSPTYIDGKLVGAVSYRFGQFSQDAIAGITPIESMIDIYDGDEVGPIADAARPAMVRQPIRVSDFRARELPALRLPDRTGFVAKDLRPIATPIAMSGLDPETAAALGATLEEAGFVGVAGSAMATQGLSPNGPSVASVVKAAPIAPASPIAALLTRGDITLAAIGTVTMVEKNRVFAFGHPFMGYGHVRFPMATAAIINTLASPAGSYKQGAPSLTVGAITHDRLTAIAGDIGDEVLMIPTRVVLQTDDEPLDSPGLITNVEVVDNPIWMPVMLDTVISSAGARRLGYEAGGTVDYEANIEIGEYTLTIKDTISAPTPLRVAAYASRDVAGSVAILQRNDFEIPKVRRIDVKMRVSAEVRLEEILDVHPLVTDAAPGDVVKFVTTLRAFRGGTERVTLSLRIPDDASGTLSIVVGGGLELDRRDGNVRGEIVPNSLEDVLGILSQRRPARGLYARIYQPRLGYRDGTELYTALPVSQRAMLLAQTHAGQARLDEAFGPETMVGRPRVVAGERTIKVNVRPKP